MVHRRAGCLIFPHCQNSSQLHIQGLHAGQQCRSQGSQITGVQTNDTSLGPYGIVSITRNGRVILSAGSFGSSRILFMSGIGPAAANLPPMTEWIHVTVGQNVSDNPAVRSGAVDNPPPADAAQYLKDRSGVLAASSANVRLNFWLSSVGTDGKSRWAQGTVRPGGLSNVSTSYSYNASQIFSVTVHLSENVTSRGRIGIDSNLQATLLIQPWLVDPVDKSTMISVLSDIVAGVKTVPNLTLIEPDNCTTIEQFGE
ncbi:cellobiose dehydrogenase [Piloderma croceum F 1598]|uniref:Cellobiose dehydrogenase n=1 Tax=Piloderma croceum (strain F 1598) TaxID=765440 RepID=A0A0C3BHP7_PILCF|nr:cellobiose dehydrogenase [Piloderma croceum F 1598]